jgi:hypothetical protein
MDKSFELQVLAALCPVFNTELFNNKKGVVR